MKSRYISSTTGRMPAIAAPTPRPTIALSEIGVSRTRSPKRSCRPRVRPNTLPPAATSMPATNTRSSVASSASSADVDRVHRAEHRRVGGGRGRLGAFGSRAGDEVGQRRDRRRGHAPRRVDRVVELARDRRLHAIRASSSLTPADRSRRACTSSGSRASHSAQLFGRSGSAAGRLRSGRASGRSSASTIDRAASGARRVDRRRASRPRSPRRRCRRPRRSRRRSPRRAVRAAPRAASTRARTRRSRCSRRRRSPAAATPRRG